MAVRVQQGAGQLLADMFEGRQRAVNAVYAVCAARRAADDPADPDELLDAPTNGG